MLQWSLSFNVRTLFLLVGLYPKLGQDPGIKNDRISCSTACGTAHIRLHIREADMRRPLRISARGDTQLIVHFLKREREPK